MAAISDFTSEEQQTLKFGPLWVFQVIAGADKDWDEAESNALQDWINQNAPNMGEVSKETLLAVVADFNGNMEKFATDDRTAGNGLREISKILDSKSKDDEAEFEKALQDLGKAVAGASDAISTTEQEVLDKMKEILDES